MNYFRVHTSDIAWLTKKPRGIFTTVGKLVEAKTLTEEETAEYKTDCTTLPGQIIYEDEFQIAVINEVEGLEVVVKELNEDE